MNSLKWRIAGVLLNLLWNTVITKVWRKRADHLSCFFGLHEVHLPPQNRLLFAFDENKLVQRAFRVIVLHSVVLLCMFLGVPQQYDHLTPEVYVCAVFPSPTMVGAAIRVVPGRVNTVVDMAFSDVYRSLRQRLPDWENHRTQAEYLQYLTRKLIMYDFFGRFGSLFYTAFYLQDVQLLRKQVYILLVLAFTKDNLIEVAMPRAVRQFRSAVRNMIRRSPRARGPLRSDRGGHDQVQSTYVDYKKFSQFAFVFLFGPVGPLAPLIAFFGSLLEMLIFGYKLTMASQRLLQIGYEGIDIWESALRDVGFLAGPSNIALICIEDPDSLTALSRLFTDMEFVLLLVILEHAVLFPKLSLQYAIRSEPHCPYNAAPPAL